MRRRSLASICAIAFVAASACAASRSAEERDLAYWERRDTRHFRSRPVSFYASVFPSVPLIRHEGDYYDLGERISIMVGRKLRLSEP